jgi:hypothetical protein
MTDSRRVANSGLDDQVAAYLRDHTPATTTEVWLGVGGNQPWPGDPRGHAHRFGGQVVYHSLHRLAKAGLAKPAGPGFGARRWAWVGLPVRIPGERTPEAR